MSFSADLSAAYRIPPALQPGQTVAVLAPASRLPYESLTTAFRVLRDDWHLEVLEGETLRLSHYSFAGTDARRRAELQAMLDNPDIRAIFAARGGYGSCRLLDGLDFTGFLRAPKWLVGFSDITALHCQVNRLGICSLHATMPKLFGEEGGEEAVESLRNVLFGEPLAPYAAPLNPLNRPGLAQGPLLGGNLTMLVNMLGTASEPDYEGRILFIEDVDETYFSLDRLLLQLRRSGRLEKLAGLVVGQFSEMRAKESMPFGASADEIIAEHVADYAYPVSFDFPVGHVPRNLAMPLGYRASLAVTSTSATLSF